MRKIKFRGKAVQDYTSFGLNIKKGEWVYGYLAIYSSKPYIITPETSYWIEVDPETVGQYTTIDDINGKEIYEGDIVKNLNTAYDKGYEDTIAIVEFRNGAFVETYWGNVLAVYPNLEVLGNIYDNPELVEGQS